MSCYRANSLMLLNGLTYERDEVVETDGLSRHRLKQLLASRKLRREMASEGSVVASTPFSDEGAAPVAPDPELVTKRPRKRRGTDHRR